MPGVKKQMDGMGAEPVGDTPEQMAERIRGEIVKFSALATRARRSVE